MTSVQTQSVSLQSENIFDTPNVRIDASLVGARLTFPFAGHDVTIAFPSSLPESESAFDGALGPARFRRTSNSEIEHIELTMREVRVHVSHSDRLSVPSAYIGGIDVDQALLTPRQIEVFDNLACHLDDIASRAFERWIRVTRWVSGYGRLFRVSPSTAKPSHELKSVLTCTLLDSESHTQIYAWNPPFSLVVGGPFITEAIWTAASNHLAAQVEPPIFVDLYFEAEAEMIRGSYRTAVVDAAIAAETFIRSVVRRALPDKLSPNATRILDEQNIRNVLNHLLVEAMQDLKLEEPSKLTLKAIHELFNLRNAIVHSGSAAGLDGGELRRLMDAVRLLAGIETGKPAGMFLLN